MAQDIALGIAAGAATVASGGTVLEAAARIGASAAAPLAAEAAEIVAKNPDPLKEVVDEAESLGSTIANNLHAR